jgi:DNA helicase-2/ATP-dependent DNA helicase PcrA
MVDEFQDTNLVQMKFISLLYKFTGEKGDRSLMLVGDPGQSIYGFRGARFENWADILTSENVTRFELETNYRSTPGIISLANVIDSDAQFTRKPAKPSSQAFDNGKPILQSFKSAGEEATAICERIVDLHGNRVSCGQQAILSRTVATLQRLEIELLSRKIPYKLVGGVSLNKSAHIRDVMAIFEFILNNRDVIALERVLKLIPGIGQKSAERISNLVTNNTRKISLIALLHNEISHRNTDAKSIIKAFKIALKRSIPIENRILRLAKLMKVVFDKVPQYSQNLEDRMLDFDALAEIAQQFTSLQEFVSSMSLDPLSSGQGTVNDDPKEQPVTLSTIHSAKGLEWDVVFLPNLLEGKFPSAHAKSKEALAEERRMFYVAVTRAKKCLILSRPVSFMKLGRKEIFKDSPFLEICGLKNAVQRSTHLSSAAHPQRSAS